MRRVFIATPAVVIGFLVFGLSCIELRATTVQPINNAGSQFEVSTERQLAEAVRIAKQGNVSVGLNLAQQALESHPTDIKTKLTYIESLVEIQKMPGDEHDDKLLDNAILVANQIEKIEGCNGSLDPSLGFGHMRALGQLAYSIETIRPEQCIQLKYTIGHIAENLRRNPRVAVESHKYLALPYFDKARAHANRGEEQLAAESLQVAFQLGFSDVEQAQEDATFQKLGNAEEVAKIIQNGSDRITEKLEKWAHHEIAAFKPFIYTFNVVGIGQDKISSADYKGKILVVDLWATWCAPCKKAIPHYMRLQNEFRDQNVAVVGIAVDNPDAPESTRSVVTDFVEKQKLNYACGLGGHSVLNKIPGETSLPTTLFIDSEGKVRCVIKGYHPYAELEALTKEVAKLESN